MLDQLEVILKKDDGALNIYHRSSTDKGVYFKIHLMCRFGELKVEDKSITDGIMKILHSYKVLSENEVTVDKTPF